MQHRMNKFKYELEIWGRAQHEAARRPKSDFIADHTKYGRAVLVLRMWRYVCRVVSLYGMYCG